MMENIKDGAEDIYEGLSSLLGARPEELLSEIGWDRLLSEVGNIISGRGGEVIAFLLECFAVLLLFAVVSAIPKGGMIRLGVSFLAAYILGARLFPVSISVIESIRCLSALFEGVMPIILSALIMMGGITLAPGASVGMQLTLYITGMVTSGGLLFIIGGIMLFSVLPEEAREGREVGDGIKKLFFGIVGTVSAALGGVIALQTYITAAGDGATIRMARFTAGGMIPVVGQTVSGAISTMAGGLAYLGSLIGASTVGAIVLAALSPLLVLLLYRLALSLAEFFGKILVKDGGVSIISGFKSMLDCLISVYVLTTIIYILEIIMFISGGVSIVS